MTQQKSSSDLPEPLRVATAALRKVPGAGTVSRGAEEALDRIGAVSPRGRRWAVYTGAGVLGVAGVVEWPIAVTGAAVAWLTQPRHEESASSETTGKSTGSGSRTSSARRKTATGQRKTSAGQRKTSTGPKKASSGQSKTTRSKASQSKAKASQSKASAGSGRSRTAG
ncbi:hypothetical protein [Streptomyces albicerus]|uniref:hypothetical protein n=1 Tax=Streptomyces albicerus TaxID=2569859 RepID=UPI001CEC3692|nr:hypothetical protein [Streptomyces albicerus]